jgi:hypothetical protein
VEVAAFSLEIVEEHLVKWIPYAGRAIRKVVAAPILHNPQQPVRNISEGVHRAAVSAYFSAVRRGKTRVHWIRRTLAYHRS